MKKERKPSAIVSTIPLLLLILLLAAVISVFGSDALGGASQIALITATAVTICLSMGLYKTPWKVFEEAFENNVKGTTVSLLILLTIGALAGSWMVSGVVPTLIYYGIQIINPNVFLVCACLICAVVSVMTGSSWTTIATIGIALMGIGKAQGFADGWIAGAIISGAYFGDKISPLSDTTVLASSSSNTELFTHIKYMMFTTIPSILFAMTIFLIAGFVMGDDVISDVSEYTRGLSETYNISLWLMVVPLVTGYLIYKKVPSLITLFVSAMMAGIFALLFQPHILREIAGQDVAGATALFKGAWSTFFGPTNVETGNAMLNDLVATRGMAGMMDTIWLILCAMVFGGSMSASQFLHTFLKAVFHRLVKTRVGLVLATALNGISMNLATGDQYISIIITAHMFREEYEKQGYENRLLSRTCEDSATVTSVLVPWNTCGMTQATVLGVPTLVYLPYCFFNLISPVTTVVEALIGWKIQKRVK